MTPRQVSTSAPSTAPDSGAPAMLAAPADPEQNKALPLPRWLERVYYIFPVVLYVPDVIFNYFVYSDGGQIPTGNPLLQVSQIVLWAFMALGIVGMAYLLSVLAPWHWARGHRIQAIFCGVGVLIATGITTWNSLAFRSTGFKTFATDQWVDQIWPQLHAVSLTMILVAIAPPFWGLFWAIVQPTQVNRSLSHLRESHAERLLRMEQEAELKRLRAETNAKVRAAQLRGMAQTAAAARDQAGELLRRKGSGGEGDQSHPGGVVVEADPAPPALGAPPANVLQLPQLKPGSARGGSVMMNSAAAAPAVRAAPSNAAQAAAAQPPLMTGADVQPGAAPAGDPMPWGGARRPPTPGGGIVPAFFPDDDQMTGTTGPRPAVKRPGESGTLFRNISGDMPARTLELVKEVYAELARELNPDGTKSSMPKKEFVARLMARGNMDEATATRAVEYWQKQRKGARGGAR